MKTEPKPHVCGIIRGRVYSRAEVLQAFKIHETTLAEWQRDGLDRNKGKTKIHFFLGDDLIEFLFPHRKVSP